MKRLTTIALFCTLPLLAGSLVTGCAQQKAARTPSARPATSVIPELRKGDTDRMEIPPGEIGEELNTSLACILKHGPARATTGQEFSYGLAVKACERIGEVIVRDRLSEGLVYVRSEPAATVKERELTWYLDTMEKGERRDIRV